MIIMKSWIFTQSRCFLNEADHSGEVIYMLFSFPPLHPPSIFLSQLPQQPFLVPPPSPPSTLSLTLPPSCAFFVSVHPSLWFLSDVLTDILPGIQCGWAAKLTFLLSSFYSPFTLFLVSTHQGTFRDFKEVDSLYSNGHE